VYRHIVAHALIARALKTCIKGLTPNQVRAWLSRDEAWLDAVVAELGPRALALW
jgi:hypothetical protein